MNKQTLIIECVYSLSVEKEWKTVKLDNVIIRSNEVEEILEKPLTKMKMMSS